MFTRATNVILLQRKTKTLFSKDAFDIDGLGKKVVDNFWKLKNNKNSK